jgi:L-seryl-tRNA(Ser) seleniumtransferase
MADTLHVIPSIEQLRQRAAVRRLEARFGRAAVVAALRAEAQSVRTRLADAPEPGVDREAVARRIENSLARHLPAALSPSLRPVINATGVIVHTNLGRAPLGRPAIDRLAAAAGGYSNLEYNLERGERGSRAVHAQALLRRLTGAEDAAVVNNNAAAVLLAVAALAAGVPALDTPYFGFRDPDGLRESSRRSKGFGYQGRFAIHPSQIEIINETYGPSEAEVENALRVVAAFEDAELRGSGATSLNGQVIDVPVVRRARKLLEAAGRSPAALH